MNGQTKRKDKEDVTYLEGHFIYRLIKVLYICALSISIIIAAILYYEGEKIINCIFYFAIAYVLLNVIREGLLYLVYGKKIAWDWLTGDAQTNKSLTVDPSTAAAFVAQLILKNEKPFIKPTNMPTDSNIDTTITCAIWGYATYLYLSMIQNKFGKEISKVVQDNLIIILNRADNLGNLINQLTNEIDKALFSNLPYEKDSINNNGVSDEQLLAIYVLANFTSSPHYIKPEERANFTLEDFSSKCDNKLFTMLVDMLTTTKLNSIEVFSPLVSLMDFKKDSVLCLNASPEIIWSKNPGCFERYIQRVYYNPLIDSMNKKFSQDEVNAAKNKDLADLKELTTIIHDFYKHAPKELDLDAETQLNNQRGQIDKLIEHCYQVGGEALSYTKNLSELRKRIIECWKIFISNNSESVKQLEQAEAYHENMTLPCYNIFSMQQIRHDSPIKKYTFELLLFEDLETFNHVILGLSKDKENSLMFKNELNKFIKIAAENNISIPMINQKIVSIETIWKKL